MDNSGRSSEEQKAGGNEVSKESAHKVSGRSEDCVRNLTKDHSCYILAKNLSTFCPCPETLSEAEFKGDGLINLAKEILRLHNIKAVA
jgi:hypothetical protein